MIIIVLICDFVIMAILIDNYGIMTVLIGDYVIMAILIGKYGIMTVLIGDYVIKIIFYSFIWFFIICYCYLLLCCGIVGGSVGR